MVLGSIDYASQDKEINPYAVSVEDMSLLTKQFLYEHPPTSGRRFECYEVNSSEPVSNVARGVERIVFEKAFGNNAQAMLAEYGPYEDHSTFFISVNTETKEPAGVLRIMQNEPGGSNLKTLHDLVGIDPKFSEEAIAAYHEVRDMDKVWDIGTVAVLPEFQSAQGAVSIQLYRAMYLSAMKKGMEHFISITDARAYKMLTRHLQIPFEPLVGSQPFEYLGSSSSQAMYGYVPEFFPKMNQELTEEALARGGLKRRLTDGLDDSSIHIK